ncbi:MAG: gas vesicle protein GvpN [Oscillatoriales cyanobacterium C42_A2020_001]|nr:gas vesicle protein GvpN [Leptolyngbyaceae cyanobacterium C42_A2020_001]
MTTILRASPRRFVSTPSVERIVARALRYLQSGFSVHLRGPAGTGKTTLAIHLADLLARPMMLIYGDDEFKTSDLIGNQTGYTRKKVVDNYIHSVVKVEDELRQNWVDSRLTLACREGFTLVYDEFNRSRPEVNNVLLSALEEKLLVLPPSNNRSEYLRVNPHFRAILTSNPEEYVGVHDTQDALMDRIITINIPEPEELTQQEILVQKTECDRVSAMLIVRLVRAFRSKTGSEKSSGLRSCLMLAKICQEHEILVAAENAEFRDVCADILLSRAGISLEAATKALWEVLNEIVRDGFGDIPVMESSTLAPTLAQVIAHGASPSTEEIAQNLAVLEADAKASQPKTARKTSVATIEPASSNRVVVPHEQAILDYLHQTKGAKLTELEKALKLARVQAVDSLRLLVEQGKIEQRYRLYVLKEEAS